MTTGEWISIWIAVFIACTAIVVHFLAAAPAGWQDDYGFHYGREDHDERRSD